MKPTAPYPMPRERNLILAVLFGVAAITWALLIWQSVRPDGEMMGLTMGMGAPLFIGNWMAMMVAMMFPTAAPMILTFARIHAGRRQHGQSFVPTWIFVGGYMVVWTVFGVLAYAVAMGAEALAAHSMWLTEYAPRLGGGVLMVAGLYQLSPLKATCLSKCRTPLGFILNSWHDGYTGAFRMGVEHGVYCLGCCWLLFVILFPLGVMNVAAMAVITLLIFAEKSLLISRHISRIAAAALIAYGVLVMIVPNALSTMMQGQPGM